LSAMTATSAKNAGKWRTAVGTEFGHDVMVLKRVNYYKEVCHCNLSFVRRPLCSIWRLFLPCSLAVSGRAIFTRLALGGY
jgi:hypothetical protein